MPKVFVDDEPKVEKVVEVVEEKPAKKPRKKRAPLSEEAKAKLVERLAKARAAKKNARAGISEPAPKPKKERKKKSPIKPSPSDNGAYQKKQHELADLRHQMEMQQLRNQLDDLKRPKKSKAPIIPMQSVVEEPIVKNEPQQSISEVKEVDNPKTIVDNTPKPIRRNLANKGNIWEKIRNS